MYYYHVPSADSHPHVVIRTPDFEKDMADWKVSFIDIFLLLDYPDSGIRRKLSYPFIGFELLSHKMIREHGRVIGGLFYGIMRISRKMTRMLSTPDSSRICIRAVDIMGNSWERVDFGEPVMFDFEDTRIPVPCNYDKVLTEFYGDYMTPPPEDQRGGAQGFPYSLLEDYLEDESGIVKHKRLCRNDLPKRFGRPRPL